MKQILIVWTLSWLALLLNGCASSTHAADEKVEGYEIAPIDIVDVIPESQPDPDTIEITPIDVPGDPVPEDLPPGEELPPSPIGGPCVDDTNCVPPAGLTPLCLTSVVIFQFPGGYCTAQCTAPGDCGTDAECIDLSLARFCVRKCSGPSDCRTAEGYSCATIPYIPDTNTYCIPAM